MIAVLPLLLAVVTGADAVPEPVPRPFAGPPAERGPSAAVTVARGLRFELSPAAPVLGIDQDVLVHVIPETEGLHPTTIALSTSAGSLHDQTQDPDGSVLARLHLPTQRFPRGLLLAALAETPQGAAEAFAFLPLPALAAPAFRTDPRAEVTVTVAGRTFGPKRAGPTGEVRVPVVVPPGVEVALAHSRGLAGQVASESLDLGRPAFERVLLLAPPVAVWGRPFEAWVLSMDMTARPAVKGSVLASGERLATPLETGPGWTRFLVEPPPSGQTRMTLSVFERPERLPAPGQPPTGPAALEATVSLVADAPARLKLIPDRVHLTAGSHQRLTLVVKAEDAFGNPTSAEATKLYVDGRPHQGPQIREQGRLRAVVAAPATVGAGRMVVEALVPSKPGRAYARHEVIVDDLRPARAPPPAPPFDPTFALMARALAIWNADAGVGAGARVEAHVSPHRHLAWPAPLFATLSLSGLARERAVSASAGLSRLDVTVLPLLAGALWRLRAAQGALFLVGASVGAARLSATHETWGVAVSGSAWVAAYRLQGDLVLGTGRTQAVVGVSYLRVPGDRLSSRDRLRGELGGIDCSLGLRQRW